MFVRVTCAKRRWCARDEGLNAMTDERRVATRAQAKARKADMERLREQREREATEEVLGKTRDMASRTSVAERLKRHAEREVLELTRALEAAEKDKAEVTAAFEERLATEMASSEAAIEALTADVERANGAAEALNEDNA